MPCIGHVQCAKLHKAKLKNKLLLPGPFNMPCIGHVYAFCRSHIVCHYTQSKTKKQTFYHLVLLAVMIFLLWNTYFLMQLLVRLGIIWEL